MMDTEGKRSLEFQSFETNISFLKNVNLVFYHKHQNWKGTRVEAERNMLLPMFSNLSFIFIEIIHMQNLETILFYMA